jgi:hypothetical protein
MRSFTGGYRSPLSADLASDFSARARVVDPGGRACLAGVFVG